MKSAIQRLTNGTIELTITIPWSEVAEHYEHVVDETVKNTEIDGFRKGKAPRNVVEPKLDKTHLYEEVLKHIIPEAYGKTVTEHAIKPIINPKIELKEATEQKDWVIRALTCEKPAVTLKAYKKAVQDLKASKSTKIWKPGDSTEPASAQGSKNTPDKPTLDELLQAVYQQVDATIPELLIEHEVNRLLSELIDQTKKLGLSVEQYLSSTGRNADSVRHEYEEQAKRTLTLEFALEKIADTEGVLISDDDVETVIKTAKSDTEKETLNAQRNYIASVLRRQKTLDFLAAL